MKQMKKSWIVLPVIIAMATVSGCGNNTRLLSIQVLPANPGTLFNNTVYVSPGATVQYQIQGWYSDRTVHTIDATQGRWTSNNSAIATVDNTGLATSVGPLGVATVSVSVSGHTSTTVMSVCDFNLCPPPTS